VNPPLPIGQSFPPVTAIRPICGATALFPFVNCPPGQITINVNVGPGTYTAWIQRYLGKNEFGVSKGFNIDRTVFAPVITVT
jgi:hypothetical protein